LTPANIILLMLKECRVFLQAKQYFRGHAFIEYIRNTENIDSQPPIERGPRARERKDFLLRLYASSREK